MLQVTHKPHYTVALNFRWPSGKLLTLNSLFLRHELSECQAIAEKVCDSYPEPVGEARQNTLSEICQPDAPLAEEMTLTSWIPPLSSQSLDRASLTNFCLNARLILLHPVPRHLRSSSSFSLKSLAFKLFLLQHPSICCGWKKAQRLAQECKGKQKLHGKAWDFHSLREIRSPESHGNSEKSRVHNFPLCL